MSALRLGVVGTGSIAARHLAVLAEADPDVRVVAHLGRNPARVAEAAAKFGGAGFVDLGRFLVDGRPDAVLITVPPTQHGPIEHALIAANISFLVEKPVAIDTETAQAVALAVQTGGIVAAVGYNWRALDTLDRVRALIADNPVRMALGRYHIGTPGSPWWRYEAQSGGQMLEQACHLIDLCRALLGEGELLGAAGNYGTLPQFADGDVAGTSAALLRFAHGVPGIVTATCVLPGHSTVELRLICNAMEIVITLPGVDVIFGGQLVHYPAQGSSYARQNRAFFAAIRGGNADAVYSSYADALRTHRLCIAISDQIASGAR